MRLGLLVSGRAISGGLVPDGRTLQHIEPGSLTVEILFKTFTDWWEPFTLGVGPAGAYVSQLDQAQRDALRTRCAQLLPPAPFCISASAWSVRAHP